MTSLLEPGVRIAGKYEITGPLGRGAYGNVYRALQHPVERPVALKVISPHAAADESLRARFFREARAIARLNHPGVVTLHDYGDADGLLYMVMEYVDGRELKAIIKESAPLPASKAFDYARQIVTVLVEAHQLELIHRDLKPANIMVVQDAAGVERLKILDFGIAKLLDDRNARFQTQMGTVVGSPSYFSPEQAMGDPAGPASDQYSLGVILYEMLTGKKPFVGNSLMALINAHRFSSVPALPPELKLPASVMSLLCRTMEKQPGDRFPDARALLDVLDQTAERVSSGAPGPIEPRIDVRPTLRSDKFEPIPPPEPGPVRKPRPTNPLPGLDLDERGPKAGAAVNRGGGLVADEPAIPGSSRRTAALIPLDSAHMLYNTDAATVPEVAAIGRSASADAASKPPATEDAPALPDVQEFSASETIIKAPAAPSRPSSTRVALFVGAAIVIVGLLGMWILSRQRAAVDDEVDEGAVDAAWAEPDAAPIDAAPIVDAVAPVVDARASSDGAVGDGAVGDGGRDGATGDATRDGATGDAAPGDAAPAAVDSAPRPSERVRPRPLPRRRGRPAPKPLPYEKL